MKKCLGNQLPPETKKAEARRRRKPGAYNYHGHPISVQYSVKAGIK
jgi:hypothetical protein